MIPLNDFRRQWEDTGEAVLKAVSAVGEKGWYILGEQVAAFETALARAWGVKHAVGVASGMDALEISLKALGCGRGDKVLTTPLSAFATTLAIVKTGAAPVFTDTDEHGLIDLEQCRETLARRRDIRFLAPVHLYGHALDMRTLGALCEAHGCLLVEDCAQSILASFRGVPTGTAGNMAATSFYPTKNLGAMGDGGAILTNSGEYAEAARALRDYGQSAKYRHDRIGYNSRLDELQAAILHRAYLPKLAGWTQRRRQVARKYLDGIRHPGVHPMGAPDGSDSVWHLFPVRVEAGRKADFVSHLRACGIATGEHYPFLIPDQKGMDGTGYEVTGDCAAARAIARSEVSLPIHPYLLDEEVERVIEACNLWAS